MTNLIWIIYDREAESFIRGAGGPETMLMAFHPIATCTVVKDSFSPLPEVSPEFLASKLDLCKTSPPHRSLAHLTIYRTTSPSRIIGTGTQQHRHVKQHQELARLRRNTQ